MGVADKSMWCYLKAEPENNNWNGWFIRVADTVRSSNDYLLRVADGSRKEKLMKIAERRTCKE